MARSFVLTSPLQRGTDVVHLQRALNQRRRERHQPPLKVDGIYGQGTRHAVALAAYELGLGHYEGTPAVVRLIENPHLRNPVELAQARHREKLAVHHRAAVGGKTGLEAVVAHARSHLGVKENPPGSNTGHPYPSDWERNFGFDGEAWCGAFVGSMILAAGGHCGPRVAYVPYIVADGHSHSNGFDRWESDHRKGVGPGWAVCYQFSGGVPDHTGIVESIHDHYVTAIEGNTGGTDPQSGGMVARMMRDYSVVVGYARPRI